MLRIFVWLALLLLAGGQPLHAQSADQQVYFIAIGQEHYLQPGQPGAKPFDTLEGIGDSADLVAEELRAGGAVFGIVLKSAEGTAVTLNDVNGAIDRVLARIAADRPLRPFLVYYFAGHGLSDGLASFHFSIPGDLTYAGDVEALKKQPDFADQVIATKTLETRFEKAGIPFLMLLDNCRSAIAFGEAVQGPLSDEGFRSVTGVVDALKFMGSFRGPNPILFATRTGADALTVPNPENDQLSLAPLARRIALIAKDRKERKAAMSLGEFVWTMSNEDFDPFPNAAIEDRERKERTLSVAVTRAKWGPAWERTLFASTPRPNAEPLALTGTGTAANFCCKSQQPLLARRATGKIAIRGFASDWIADGKSWPFATPKTAIWAQSRPGGALELRLETPEGDWSVDLAPASGQRFVPGIFKDVARSGFQQPAQFGLAVSSPGRSCNSVTGSARIDAVRYGKAGLVEKLAGQFSNVCDDEKEAVVVDIDLMLLPE